MTFAPSPSPAVREVAVGRFIAVEIAPQGRREEVEFPIHQTTDSWRCRITASRWGIPADRVRCYYRSTVYRQFKGGVQWEGMKK